MGWIADLLKEIPSAARYKSKLEAMEKQLVALTDKDAVSQSTIHKLQTEIVDLRKEIKRRDDIIEKEELHGERLQQIQETLLVQIAHGHTVEEQLAKTLGMNHQMLINSLETGAMRDFVTRTNLGFHFSLELTPAGRAYLAKFNLINMGP